VVWTAENMLHYIVVTFNTTICHIQLWVSICNKQQDEEEAQTSDFTNVQNITPKIMFPALKIHIFN